MGVTHIDCFSGPGAFVQDFTPQDLRLRLLLNLLKVALIPIQKTIQKFM